MSSWSTGHVDITRDTTTLYASDGDVFLRRGGFSKGEGAKAIGPVLPRRGRPPESVFDFVRGINAVARTKTHQDARLDLETRAKRLLNCLSGPHGSLQRGTKGRRSPDEYGLGERLRAAQAEKPVIASACRRSSPAPRATSRPTSC